ncbi:MAG: hypothetical protein R2854_06150 [Caldilineaceae bacterium]
MPVLAVGRVGRHATGAHGASLLSDPSLTRTTIYFTHYLFETYRLLDQPAALFERMGLWFELAAQGFKTTPEQPEPSRSDCHGWGAHPLYHYFATLLGIRPAGLGFDEVEIRPMPGDLTHLSGEMVHPARAHCRGSPLCGRDCAWDRCAAARRAGDIPLCRQEPGVAARRTVCCVLNRPCTAGRHMPDGGRLNNAEPVRRRPS